MRHQCISRIPINGCVLVQNLLTLSVIITFSRHLKIAWLDVAMIYTIMINYYHQNIDKSHASENITASCLTTATSGKKVCM